MNRKWDYYKIIQQHCGGAWYDVSHYETDSTGYAPREIRALLKHDLREYRVMGYPTRVIFRREAKGEPV